MPQNVATRQACTCCGAELQPRALACISCDAPVARHAPHDRVQGRVTHPLVRIGLAVGAAAAVLLGAAATYVGRSTNVMVQEGIGGASRLIAAMTAPDARSAWDAAIETFEAAAPPPGAPDIAASRMLVAYLADPADSASWDADFAAAASIAPDPRRSAIRPARMLPQLDALTDVQISILEKDTVSAWLAIWRRAAVDAPSDGFWGRRGDVTSSTIELPTFNLGRALQLAHRNDAAAILALRQGDYAAAEARARENIGVALRILRSPTTLDHFIALQVIESGGRLLSAAGERSGNAALAREGAAVERGVRNLRPPQRSHQALQVALADPASPTTAAITASARYGPALQAEMPLQLTLASCLSAREVLFGIDDARLALARQVPLHVAPAYRGIASANVQLVERWSADPAAAAQEIGALGGTGSMGATFAGKALAIVGLDGLRARLQVCSML